MFRKGHFAGNVYWYLSAWQNACYSMISNHTKRQRKTTQLSTLRNQDIMHEKNYVWVDCIFVKVYSNHQNLKQHSHTIIKPVFFIYLLLIITLNIVSEKKASNPLSKYYTAKSTDLTPKHIKFM